MNISKFLSGLGIITLTAVFCLSTQSAFLVKADYNEASVGSSDPFLGEIVMFGGNFAPRGWALCEGQLLPINQYQALFSILGTTYGGDGRTTFALPDLRGRTAVQQGTGPGLSEIRLGQKGGRETITLTKQNMPSHNHGIIDPAMNSVKLVTSTANTTTGEGKSNVMVVDPEVGVTGFGGKAHTANSGGGQSVNIRNPYLGVNFIIALQGTFPSRS